MNIRFLYIFTTIDRHFSVMEYVYTVFVGLLLSQYILFKKHIKK